MDNGFGGVQSLADLLREIGATPRVMPERVVRSTLYDLDYHVAVVACAFIVNADPTFHDGRVLVAHWLKLLQFIAVRPTLLPRFQRWARSRRRPDLDTWQKMPRGYLGDRTHDRTIEMLVANKVIYRASDTLVSAERFGVLASLYDDIVIRNLLISERRTLAELAKIPVNKTLLKGE